MYCAEAEWVYVIAAIISLLGSTSVLWFIHQFVKARAKLKADKSLYAFVLAFFLFIAMTLISWALMNAFECRAPIISTVMSQSGRLGFTLQLSMILWLLFYRLNRIFKGSVFALEKRTKWLFRVTYLLLIGGELLVVAVFATPLRHSIGTTVVLGTVFFFVFVYITALVSLLVYKLVTVAKQEKLANRDQSMVPIITKVFILSLTPIIAIFFMGLAAVVNNVLLTRGLPLTTYFTVALCANFYSILFGFTHFDGYYTKVCGSCHRCCESVCSKKVVPGPMAATIQSVVKSRSGDILCVIHSAPESEPEPETTQPEHTLS